VPEKNIENGIQEQDLGRSRGGFSTKIHAACYALGNPIKFVITAGQRSDYTKAYDLIESQEMSALIADKGYDANFIVEYAESVKADVVVPSRKNRKIVRDYDSEIYKERNLIERMFNKIKNFRRVATESFQ